MLTLNLTPDIDHHDGIGEPHWERSERMLVTRLVQPGMVCVDAGANVGDYTLLMSRLVGETGTVFAFEPAPGTFQRLFDRCALHDAFNVRLIERALWYRSETLALCQFPEESQSVWASLGRPEMGVPIAGKVEVRAVSLDEWFCGGEPWVIHYLKLDVEGAEADALLGAAELLARKMIGMIQFEISTAPLIGMGRRPEQTFEALDAAGFTIHRIMPGGFVGDAVKAPWPRPHYENFIAFAPIAGPIPPAALSR